MSQQLINHSPDLKQLRDEGFEIEVIGGHLLVHHIPYLNSQKEIKFGSIVTILNLANPTFAGTPHDHTVYFSGDIPCDKMGNPLTSIINSSNNQQLTDKILVNHYFSSKPPSGNYPNYYEKIRTYTEILSSQAKSIDSSVTAKTFKVIIDSEEETAFNYYDTNSTRSNIYLINSKFRRQKIGIIGLGGTGSYILDFVAKTPVDEILLFDGDVFLQHNAFRSPGAPSIETLDKQFKKVDYLAEIYSKMHRGIKPHAIYVTEENFSLLGGLSFVFICIDSNKARGTIISKLLQLGIPFIDVGLGVNIADDNLVGTLRVTVGTPSKFDHLSNRIGTEDIDDNEYSTNIQIADLNALNGLLAVIKWKKMSGFYQDLKQEHYTTYTINTGQLINGDLTA